MRCFLALLCPSLLSLLCSSRAGGSKDGHSRRRPALPGLLRLAEQIGCVCSSWDKQSSVTETSEVGLANALGEKLRWGKTESSGPGKEEFGLGGGCQAAFHPAPWQRCCRAICREQTHLEEPEQQLLAAATPVVLKWEKQPCTAPGLHEQ